MASVLIVEDDSAVCDVLERFLKSAGYADVTSVPDAQAALLAMAGSQPTVVLCDVRLREGPTGLWLAERIRELYPTTATILATADATISPVQSLRKGIVAYLVKPFRRDDVIRAVAEGVRWSATETAKGRIEEE